MNAGAIAVESKSSIPYRLGLAMVALAMVILPCVYLALTALAEFSVTTLPRIISGRFGGCPMGHSRYALIAKVVFSGTPLLAGGTIALFMVKPLFARRAARMHPLALDPKHEPRVYALVQEVCRTAGAPAPRRVELNCELNASASFDRGTRGFYGNALVLTLGMPLVAGLTEPELAGVITHEFGHFSTRRGDALHLSHPADQRLVWRGSL